MFVVLLFMAGISVYGSDRSVQSMGFDGQDFAGPVCLPGDPCGPWPGGSERFAGPVCYPGDPCGSGGATQPSRMINSESIARVCLPGDPCGLGGIRQVIPNASSFMGPVCYPGDPCGSGGGAWNGLRPTLKVANFAGPVCYPGDPCGSGGKPLSKVLAES